MQSIHSRNTTFRTQYTPIHRTNIRAFLILPIVRPRKTERESLRNLGRKSGQTIFSNCITSTMDGGTSFGTVQNSLPKQGLTSRSVSLAAFEICLAQCRLFFFFFACRISSIAITLSAGSLSATDHGLGTRQAGMLSLTPCNST